jgi:hypothetical protein
MTSVSLQDAYAEPDRDTRNLAGFMLAVAVQDVQDMPPIFTSVPPVTVLKNTIQKVSAYSLGAEVTSYFVCSSSYFIPYFSSVILLFFMHSFYYFSFFIYVLIQIST